MMATAGYSQMDPNEPNSELGNATRISLGGSVAGTIEPAGDVDFFGFEIASPGILEVKLNSVPDEMRARIDLYGKNFNFITRRDASNPGDLVTLTLDLASPALYYIGIVDLARKSHDAGYTFDLGFDPLVDVNEPNGEAGDAKPIEIGNLVEGYIFPKGDLDIYKLYANGSGILEVKAESVPENMRTRIDLYGKNFNFITRVDASNPGDLVTLKHDVVNHGWYPEWYYIGIVDLSGGSYNVPYAFKADFEPVIDENEPNGEIGNAVGIDLGDQIEGYIFSKGDVDFFKIEAPSPGILEVKTVSVPDEMRTRIDLYGKSFNFITRKDASNPGDKTTLSFDVKNPGVYHIGIVDLAGNSLNVPYTFETSFEGVTDGNEPNSEIGDAAPISPGEAVGGVIFPAGVVDFYKIWADGPGDLEVKLESLPEDMRARIDLYGKNFNFITRADATNPGDLATLKYEAPGPGWYYIGVSDLAGKSHSIGYTFRAVGEGLGASGSGPTEDGVDGTKAGEVKDVPDGTAGGTMASYQEATITHSGFDFSEGATGEYPTFDGEIIEWQPSAEDHPDYPRDSGYLWWRNTHLDNVNFSSQTKDMGAVDIATVRNVPAEWDRSPLIPPLLLGHTVVAKCHDGYVKFHVISVDSNNWSAVVRYSYSPDAVFDDLAS
ncbi:MAG: PPC domain-containing protein [Methanothrix sp.]|nr:PPC domain-containing protein [Methanothrix sp.]